MHSVNPGKARGRVQFPKSLAFESPRPLNSDSGGFEFRVPPKVSLDQVTKRLSARPSGEGDLKGGDRLARDEFPVLLGGREIPRIVLSLEPDSLNPI